MEVSESRDDCRIKSGLANGKGWVYKVSMNKPDFGETFRPEPIMPVIPQETDETSLLSLTPPTERGSKRWNWGARIRNVGRTSAVAGAMLLGAKVTFSVISETPLNPYASLVRDIVLLATVGTVMYMCGITTAWLVGYDKRHNLFYNRD